MNTAATKTKEDDDWWDKLHPNIQAEIDDALADLDKGNGIPHEIVIEKYSKWFTR